MRELTEKDLVRQLRSLIVDRSQAELARHIGVSRSFLNEVINGRRKPTGKILKYLGVKERMTYIKTGKQK